MPQPSNQRSRSFDSAGSEDASTFLEVPRRFQRRKSSTKTPPPCVHCQYVDEQRKRRESNGFYFDAQEYKTLTYSDSSSSEEEETEYVTDFFLTNSLLPVPAIPSPCGITFTLSPTICDYPAFPMPTW